MLNGDKDSVKDRITKMLESVREVTPEPKEEN